MLEKLEDIVFRSRLIILGFFAAFTIYSGFYATQQRMTAGFEKQLPAGHEYIQTFQEYRDRLFGSNRIIVVLKQREGVIWNKDYFSTYKDLTDALFYLPGVAWVSLVSIVMTLPFFPGSGWIVDQLAAVNFLAIVTPVLAYAGLALSRREFTMFRQTGWKLIIISLLVFTGTYVGSAVVAQVLL